MGAARKRSRHAKQTRRRTVEQRLDKVAEAERVSASQKQEVGSALGARGTNGSQHSCRHTARQGWAEPDEKHEELHGRFSAKSDWLRKKGIHKARTGWLHAPLDDALHAERCDHRVLPHPANTMKKDRSGSKLEQICDDSAAASETRTAQGQLRSRRRD
jgi:hypothetical protein